MTYEDTIESIERQIISTFMLLPPAVAPPPLMCPVCHRTRLACVQFYGRDPEHERMILAHFRGAV